MGRADEAASVMANGVALARELSHPFSLAMALIHASALHLERGAAFAGRDHGMEALAIAREQSFSLLSSWASCYAGASRVALGELREGLAMIRDGRGCTGNRLANVPLAYPGAIGQSARGHWRQRRSRAHHRRGPAKLCRNRRSLLPPRASSPEARTEQVYHRRAASLNQFITHRTQATVLIAARRHKKLSIYILTRA